MSSNEPSELRLAAILVWRYEHLGELGTTLAAEAIKARDEERIARFRDALLMIFRGRNEFNFRINGGCLEAEIEDLRFIALEFLPSGKQEPLTVVTLLGRCPSCGAEVMSEPFHALSKLGKILENFKPIRQHYCYGDFGSD